MAKLLKIVLFGVITFLFGYSINYINYKQELKQVAIKFSRTLNNKKIDSFDKIIETLNYELVEKDKIISRLKSESEKINTKLINIENQFSDLINTMMSSEQHKNSVKESVKNTSANKMSRPAEKIINDIKTALSNKDVATVAKLLKELASYGKEYYQFVFDSIRKVFQDSEDGRGRRFGSSRIELFKMLRDPVFTDYYKWVLENTDIERRAKMPALEGLIWSSEEDVKPYLYEQFKKQDDNGIRSRIFQFLSDVPEYKKEFIDMAKDFSQNENLRRRIILEYANDASPEADTLFSYLKTNEQNEQIKKIVSLISDVKDSKEAGYVIFNDGEILREKDIILKIGDTDVTSNRQVMFSTGRFFGLGGGGPPPVSEPPNTGLQNSEPQKNKDVNVQLTIKRDGAIITVDIPKSKLASEIRLVDGIYVSGK